MTLRKTGDVINRTVFNNLDLCGILGGIASIY